jgi:hypothetical protein
VALSNPKPTEAPKPELPARKPAQSVLRDDCYCTHSADDHRGPAGLNERGGLCTLCACEHYLRRPCVCGHLAGGHNGACLVRGCNRCKAFRQDNTPEVLLRAGVRAGDTTLTTTARLRFLQRPDIPVRIRIWATGLLHADRGRLAVKRDESGNTVPLTPADIVKELNALDTVPCVINCRREFRFLEQMGAMRRVGGSRGARYSLRLYFYLKPLPNRLISEDDEEFHTDRSVRMESVSCSNPTYLQNALILPAKRGLVKLFLKVLTETHEWEVANDADRSVQIADRSVRIEQSLEPVTELLKSVLEVLLQPPGENGEVANVSNSATDQRVRAPKKTVVSDSENPPYKKRPSDQGGRSSSSAVKAEEDDTSLQSIEPTPPAYRDFRSLYPKEKLDDAKARIAFNALAPLEKRFCFQGLLAHLTCDRWIKSLANNQAKYVPLASNFIKRREYAGDPPPHIDITAELTPAERRQQQKAEQLAAAARELYEGMLRDQK